MSALLPGLKVPLVAASAERLGADAPSLRLQLRGTHLWTGRPVAADAATVEGVGHCGGKGKGFKASKFFTQELVNVFHKHQCLLSPQIQGRVMSAFVPLRARVSVAGVVGASFVSAAVSSDKVPGARLIPSSHLSVRRSRRCRHSLRPAVWQPQRQARPFGDFGLSNQSFAYSLQAQRRSSLVYKQSLFNGGVVAAVDSKAPGQVCPFASVQIGARNAQVVGKIERRRDGLWAPSKAAIFDEIKTSPGGAVVADPCKK